MSARYARSANLERDRGSVAAVESYVPTNHAKELLNRVLDVDHASNQPRAWSIVGPYGSGKSSFAHFLYELVGEAKETRASALSNLHKHSEDLASGFAPKKPWCRVVLTGSDEPIASAFLRALLSLSTSSVDS